MLDVMDTRQNLPADAPYAAWIGRTQRGVDDLSLSAARGMWATLDKDGPPPEPGDAIPPLWHWMLFNAAAPQRELGPDGHPARGGFLPPVALPRRMWAGGRLEFTHPLRVGDEVVRDSRIVSVDAKEGASGPLCFVTVRHDLANGDGVAVQEQHDIVYRGAPGPDDPKPVLKDAPCDERFSRRVTPDAVMLFRYSALTFNGHRIHYDRPYVTEVEGYPGLIVHGPLIATLLVDLLLREHPDAHVRRFQFKAVSPLFDGQAFDLCGRPDGERRYALWARNPEGKLAMQASAELY